MLLESSSIKASQTSPNSGHTAPHRSARIVLFGNDFVCPQNVSRHFGQEKDGLKINEE